MFCLNNMFISFITYLAEGISFYHQGPGRIHHQRPGPVGPGLLLLG